MIDQTILQTAQRSFDFEDCVAVKSKCIGPGTTSAVLNVKHSQKETHVHNIAEWLLL